MSVMLTPGLPHPRYGAGIEPPKGGFGCRVKPGMTRHAAVVALALLLSLYAPLHLYAVNKEVHFVPPPSG
jgi:hypothetical protein